MYNLPKFDSEKAAKNLNKLTKSNAVTLSVHFPCFKNVVEAISTKGADWVTHFACHNGRC